MSKLISYTQEVIGTVELEAMREQAAADYKHLARAYHYGASATNLSVPEGLLERIKVRVGNGTYKGVGKVVKALDETQLSEKKLKAQTAIVVEMIEALKDAGKDYKVAQVVVLYNPVKLFVLLSNGNAAEDIVYCAVSGKSNGTGTRKEINWPEGVEKTSKAGRKAFFEKSLAKYERNKASMLKTIARLEAEGEEYPRQLEFYKGTQMRGIESDIAWAKAGLERNV